MAEPEEPSPILGVGSAGMGLLKPLFAAEAKWQAETFGGEEARAEAVKRLDEESRSAPVVIYTYGLSPFSTEATKFLDETGCTYKKIELGLEWFLLAGVPAALRAELLARHGQSSLPHVFIGGESIGGLYSGTPGLVELKKQGKLMTMLQDAGAL
jgi:glutaredoxin